MKVKHAVITSVDRDDLARWGRNIWVKYCQSYSEDNLHYYIRDLNSRFCWNWENLNNIIEVAPEIVSHNIETVRRLTKTIRVQAKYNRSLELCITS